ncbi:MAG: type II toxin-antitoxin system VapC family toxin [Austwickia sp.]|nr:type II toxin-antitoxin system VapC family toxin [Actinomycetota bacterium]MCB1254031.1 type II toxin-antitoxin system VapC family toxin [Austwickia sp.]MCO5307776.1 type II toxin-antitoxin system VapC family toxin [Austwickia sp.]
MIRYIDTSAALKLLVEEAESEALAADLTLSAANGDRLVASWLLHTELHCAAQRRSALDPGAVRAVLDGLTLVDVERVDLLRAASSAWRLRSADAIHLAVALRVEADELVTYDRELAAVAARIGCSVVCPGFAP